MDQWNEKRALLTECEAKIRESIIGMEDIVSQLLMVMLSGGNILLEGMPGLGKTKLVQTVGKVFDLESKRIQFTPDLMPQDITGTTIFMRSGDENTFTFRKGPVFANLILADEINRATPKTQSAMLEAMQEGTVTEGGVTYPLPKPFFVLATQNPIETEGTYPLPEAQLDRFLCKLNLKFPKSEELKKILYLTEYQEKEKKTEEDKTICRKEDLLEMMEMVSGIQVADPVMDHLVRIMAATHEKNPYIRVGASPRGAQAILRLAKAKAFIEGRFNISFEDVRYAAYPALRHRIVLSFDALTEGISSDEVIRRILESCPVSR
ncbi:MAG: MoxR family ATPase [Lachnospiraceae bacterium]|nr:MoxR family ATPase [Lachnospiraceae bacterium]